MSNLTKAAEKVVKSIVKSVGYYSDIPPVVVDNGDEVLISWSEGPYEWTLGNYGLYEELAEAGMTGTYESSEFYKVPKGYSVEPQNSYQLCIYKD